ncbi:MULTISPECIES: hypothetical protein [unclassified Nonomuraea]|uniref:hypothetical protein n=1 Tax=unclassified Nonomuraea TaxID=2593643 RepID=UPI0035C07A2D
MHTVAIVVPLVWLAWLVATDWLPMFPLNDLSGANVRGRALAAAINYPFPLLVAAGVAYGRAWSLLAAMGICVLILAGHLYNWWLPYLGVSNAGQRELYRREYARTLKILPAEGHDVVVDVQHMVVGALSLIMLVTTLVATLNP